MLKILSLPDRRKKDKVFIYNKRIDGWMGNNSARIVLAVQTEKKTCHR